MSLADLAARTAASQPRRRLWVVLLLEVLGINLWQQGISPRSAAAVDVARLLLGGKPAGFPPAVVREYADGLGAVLARPALEPLRARVEQQILDHALGEDFTSPEAIELLNTWAVEERLAPGLVEFIAGLPEDKRPYKGQLHDSYWLVFALDPRLSGYACAGRLLAAVLAAVQDPVAARLRDEIEARQQFLRSITRRHR